MWPETLKYEEKKKTTGYLSLGPGLGHGQLPSVQHLGRHLHSPEVEYLLSCLILAQPSLATFFVVTPLFSLIFSAAEATSCSNLLLGLAFLLTQWEALS